MLSLFYLVSLAQAQTPWWKLLVEDIPHDAGALVAYALLAGFVGFIWLGNRKRSP